MCVTFYLGHVPGKLWILWILHFNLLFLSFWKTKEIDRIHPRSIQNRPKDITSKIIKMWLTHIRTSILVPIEIFTNIIHFSIYVYYVMDKVKINYFYTKYIIMHTVIHNVIIYIINYNLYVQKNINTVRKIRL